LWNFDEPYRAELGLGSSEERAEAGGVLPKVVRLAGKIRNCRLTRATQDNPTTRPINKTTTSVTVFLFVRQCLTYRPAHKKDFGFCQGLFMYWV